MVPFESQIQVPRSKMKVGIINVGLGNIASIQRMLERVGVYGIYISSHTEFTECDALILPGVGHFDEGMRTFRKAGII